MKSLSKAIDTIDAVAEAGSVGIRELSSITGFPPSTIHRIVATLVQRHYFQQDPVTKRYSLSFRFLELGSRVQQQTHLTSIARPHLERLMAETRESINLAVRDGDSAVYLDNIQSNYSMLQLFTRPGARVPLYATGVGKLFLSRMSSADLDAYLQRVDLIPFTRHTVIEREQITEELKLIRTRGFAVDNEEMEAGVRCVAALINDYDGRPAASVSITGAAMRVTPDRVEHFGELIKSCALTISHELGFNPAN
ncbi:Transcriptional regulator, IclR family [Olavius sp. associated proteobacterium Delta 1]|nr:Transcriptional regulator, IclR family [Olavius sp. associated proteobacterium Delta 1]